MKDLRKFSETPSIHRATIGFGRMPAEGYQIRCEDKFIRIRPCSKGSEKGPDGDFPFIGLQEGEEEAQFPMTTKEQFDTLFQLLWGMSK